MSTGRAAGRQIDWLEARLPKPMRPRYVPRVDFLVLGPLEVAGAEGSVPLGGPKQRAVLAHLLVRANQVVSVDSLIDGLWGEEPPDAARGTVQAYVSNLRRALGSARIERHAPGYVLHVEDDEVDASQSLIRGLRLVHAIVREGVSPIPPPWLPRASRGVRPGGRRPGH